LTDDLTEYERSLAERLRLSLFDIYEDPWDEGLIDPSHPEFPAVMAIVLPPRKRRRKTKPKTLVTQERFDA
jgi:hypothetical protein